MDADQTLAVVLMTAICSVTYSVDHKVLSADAPDGVKSYCESEVVRLRCKHPNEVIIITHAKYGRMREGRCMTSAYGVVGCSADVIHLLDALCSGRRQCDASVASLVDEQHQPCPLDFRSYLELSHKCVTVAYADKSMCRRSAAVELRHSRGFLSNLVADETGCGSIDSAWWIAAEPGQRLRLTLYDFAVGVHPSSIDASSALSGRHRHGANNICKVRVVIKEDPRSRGHTICRDPREGRRRLIYMSRGSLVEVRLTTANRISTSGVTSSPTSADRLAEKQAEYFLVEFEAVGCPDVEAPVNGWMRREGGDIIMGCNASAAIWRMYCNDNHWEAHGAKNCTPVSLPAVGWLASFDRHKGHSLILVICVAGPIGLLILICGIICLRANRERRQRALAQTGCPPVHVSSDVSAAFLSQPPTSGKALINHQQSVGLYARTDDVNDVLLGAGNDYFHHHRRRQFHQPCHQQDVQFVSGATTRPPLDFTGTCRSDAEHIYESPSHDMPPSHPSSIDGRQMGDTYYTEHDFRVTTS